MCIVVSTIDVQRFLMCEYLKSSAFSIDYVRPALCWGLSCLCVAVRPVDVCLYHPELLWFVSLPAVFPVDEDSICSDSEPALALSVTLLFLRVPFLLLDRWYGPKPRHPPP